ncbi:MAG: hypothetical protein RJA70_1998 [Pseudomonadota bacterium]
MTNADVASVKLTCPKLLLPALSKPSLAASGAIGFLVSTPNHEGRTAQPFSHLWGPTLVSVWIAVDPTRRLAAECGVS